MTSPPPAAPMDVALTRGDLDAVVALAWEEHHLPLLRRIRRQGVPEVDADDVLMDVFALMVDRIDDFEGGADGLRGWLFTLARYEVMTWRTRRRRDRVEPDPDQVDAASQEAQAPLALSLRPIQVMLAELDGVDRELFVAALIEGCGTAEVVARLEERCGVQLSGAAVRKRKSRLRAQAAERLSIEPRLEARHGDG